MNNTIDQSQTQIFQQQHIPKKLLTPTSFKNLMFSQGRYGNNDSMILQNSQNDIYNKSQQGTIPNPLNDTINQTKSLSQFKDYHFTARNLPSVCDNDFISGKTKHHFTQKFGQREAGKKLAPLFMGSMLRELHKKKPRRKQDSSDARTFFSTQIERLNLDIGVTLKSFTLKFLSQNQEENGIEGGLISQTDINFSDMNYLCQHNYKKIEEFFQNYVYIDDLDMIFLDYFKFGIIPVLKEDIDDDHEGQDSEYPPTLQKSIETQDDTKTLILEFPIIEFYVEQIDHTQNYTLTQNEIRDLFHSKFKSLPTIISKYLNYQEIVRQVELQQDEQNIQKNYVLDEQVQDFYGETQDGLISFFENIQNQTFGFLISIPTILDNECSIKELENIIERMEYMNNNKIKPIVITLDNYESILKVVQNFKDKNKEINFPIFSDGENKKIFQQWGLIDLSQDNEQQQEQLQQQQQQQRAYFFINSEKVLKYKHITSSNDQQPRDFCDMETIINQISQEGQKQQSQIQSKISSTYNVEVIAEERVNDD